MYKPWDSLIWKNIAMKVLPDSKPKGNNQTKDDLFQFDVAFTDPTTDDNVTSIYPDNGDEIVICDSPLKSSVMGKSCAGKIIRKEIKCNGWTGNYILGNLTPSLNYRYTVRQHEFSKKPFKLEYEIATPINTILDAVLLNETIDLLGGVFIETNGTTTVIPKYINLAENIDISQYILKNSSKEHLTELLKIPAYEWGLKYYSRTDATYGLKLIAQVQIWQD